jgi:hypothetical protein
MRISAFVSAVLFQLIAAVVSIAALAQSAPTSNYTSIEASPAKPVQLGYYASAHKDCTPEALPTVRIIEAPKSGLLTVKRAVLTTDKVAGCPAVKVPAQVVFYHARAGYTGPDHLNYEGTSESGEVDTYDVTITVKAPPVTTPDCEGSIAVRQATPGDASARQQRLAAARHVGSHASALQEGRKKRYLRQFGNQSGETPA